MQDNGCHLCVVAWTMSQAFCRQQRAQLLKRLEELLSWARMKIKPAKSCRISIRKGSRVVPVLAEQPVRNLGREYTAEVTERHMAATITDQLKED